MEERRHPTPGPSGDRRVRRIGLYSDSPLVGGAERLALNLAAAYDGPHELVVCSPHRAVLDEAARMAPGVETAPIELGPGRGRVLRDHRRAFAGLRLDLLQVTLANPFACRTALVAAWSSRLPTVAVEQLVMPSRRRVGAVRKRLESRLLGAHVAVGGQSARDLERWFGIPRGRVEVIHNGVPDVAVEPHRFERRPVVGSAARLEDQKSLDVLVAAVAALPDVVLVLVGDGERRADLEQQAADLGCAHRLVVLGWQDDARPYIAGFDVFALPSRNEAFPLSIVEAMLAGTPVVATPVGSVGEAVVDGETGLLVEHGDVAGLSRAISTLLADAGVRTRLSSAARDRARRELTAEVMARRYGAIWDRLLR